MKVLARFATLVSCLVLLVHCAQKDQSRQPNSATAELVEAGTQFQVGTQIDFTNSTNSPASITETCTSAAGKTHGVHCRLTQTVKAKSSSPWTSVETFIVQSVSTAESVGNRKVQTFNLKSRRNKNLFLVCSRTDNSQGSPLAAQEIMGCFDSSAKRMYITNPVKYAVPTTENAPAAQ